MAILVNVGRYDTYAAFPTGSKNVISGRENPGGKGEIIFTPAVSPTHTSSDISAPTAGAAITGVSCSRHATRPQPVSTPWSLPGMRRHRQGLS